jgi:hypothetical protein
MHPHIPLLLTSSVIAHDQSVNLKNTAARTQHAMESIDAWLRIAPDHALVICDGSGFDYSPLIASRFPGARIESLHFMNDANLVALHGRGYGEGEIVKFALSHSATIAAAGCFAKCTSKLWVENFKQCLSHWNGKLMLKGVFLDVFSPLKKSRFHHIDTRFYVASLETYRTFFIDAHLGIRKEAGYGLEECFRDIVLSQQMQGVLSPCTPIIAGLGGGTGAYYRNPRHRIWKEILRNRLAMTSSEFRQLFIKV